MKRLFIGIPIESEMAVQVAETWRNDLMLNQNRLNWTKPETWHITLFFLGDTPDEKIDLLQQLIGESFNAIKAFSTQLNGVGVFPDSCNPRVLWLGLETLQPLMSAHIKLGDLLRQNRFSFDDKPLKPHLTLARIKSQENRDSFKSLLNQYSQFNFGKVAINRVVLFESILTSQGPVYKPLFVGEL